MSPRTNYIFVDFENTQDINLDLIEGKPVKVFLILGGKQDRLPVGLVKKLLKYTAQLEVIETEQTGNHALDFVLACQIGAQSVADPGGFFHILSKDKGFEAVIRHLKERKIFGARHEEFARIPVLVNTAALSAADRVAQIAERFGKPKATRPTKRKTLVTYVAACFRKLLSEAEVEATIAGLVKEKILSINTEGKVTYLDRGKEENEIAKHDHRWTRI